MAATETSWEAGQAQPDGGLDWGWQWQHREAARLGMCRGGELPELVLRPDADGEGKRRIKNDYFSPPPLPGICEEPYILFLTLPLTSCVTLSM